MRCSAVLLARWVKDLVCTTDAAATSAIINEALDRQRSEVYLRSSRAEQLCWPLRREDRGRGGFVGNMEMVILCGDRAGCSCVVCFMWITVICWALEVKNRRFGGV